ncbi:MAG: polysaccharide biosynthesis protein [Rhodobacteraceae bacterium]|nr:polysaccharide biosynthesis protein [Paracoccaceae bacterium]MAY47693.1 polysaccharide biosynthesis protein [Paracoccaceae bacterium]
MIKKILGLVSGNGVRARAVRSTGASLMLAVGEQALRFASNLILTRLLFPEAFGLMAIVTAIIVGIELVSDLGLRSVVVQSPRGDDADFLDTVWTLKCIRGVGLWLILVAAAPLFADLYDQPVLRQLLPVAGLSIPINGFVTSNELSVSRHMKLWRYTGLKLSAQFIGVSCMSLLAWQTGSVWALVLGNLVGALAHVVLFGRYLPGIRNRPRLERDSVRDILRFSRYLALGMIATFVMTQSDRVVLGLFIPLDMLGVYNIGFALAVLPYTLAVQISGSVVLPLYRMRHPLDGSGNRANILRARRLVSLAVLGAICLLAFLGPWIVAVLYDDRYVLAGPVCVLLCLANVPRTVLAGVMNVAVAKGDTFRFMVMNVATALCQGGLIYLGVRAFGIVGAPLAIGLAPLLTYPLMAGFLRRYNNWDPLGDAVLTLGACAVIGLSVWLHFDDIRVLLS